jgi:delta 1-pyrroline-5-carboxylate dehydrogenase
MVSPLDHVPNGDISLDPSSTSLLLRGLLVLSKRPSRLVERLLPVVMVSHVSTSLRLELMHLADSSKGYFVKPTVILTKDPKSVTMTKEIFGPVMTVCPNGAFWI